ncbi:MAG: nucleoside-diphosphate kinase [Caldilineaceae bacterium]
MKMIHVSPELANEHYAVHKERPFFGSLISYITSSPVVAMVLEGSNAISVVRRTVGDQPARPSRAASADFGSEIGRNLVHKADGPDTG